MKLKAPQIQIVPEDPFKNDLLGRKTCAEHLTELLRSYEEPLVLAINATFGDGKTTFLRMWREHLKLNGFKTLYFNAWENDHSDDALASLIGEFSVGMKELNLKGTQATKAKQYLDQAKNLGAGLMKKGIPAAVRVATAGVVDLPELTEEALSKLAEEIAKEEIEKYEKNKKTLSGFRDKLKEFAQEATKPAHGEERLPLTIIVDELDRCRPPYAIQILEKIKHLFAVDGIILVIAVDRGQLGYSVQSIYGKGMNVNGYLRRFIDLDFNLPAPEGGAFCTAQFERFGLIDAFQQRIGEETRYDRKQLTESLVAFFTGFDLSLREQEHCFSLISLVLRTTPHNNYIYPFLLSILAVLKVKNPNLYTDFVERRCDEKEVIKYLLSNPQGKAFLLDNTYGLILEIQLSVCQSRDKSLSDLDKSYKQKIDSPALPQVERERAKALSEMLQAYWTRDLRSAPGSLQYIVQKIDLVTRFER